MENKKFITVKTQVDRPVEKVWELFTEPRHITHWNFASADWCCPEAESELKEGGKFSYRMEAKNQTAGFNFNGEFLEIIALERIVYQIEDGRIVEINFSSENGETVIIEKFEPEQQNPFEMQQQGWQAILDNFKDYVRKHN